MAVLVHRPDGQLGLVRRPDLVHEHDVEVALERVGERPAHRHPAARHGQHERALVAVLGQGLGQLSGGVVTIAKGAIALRRAILAESRHSRYSAPSRGGADAPGLCRCPASSRSPARRRPRRRLPPTCASVGRTAPFPDGTLVDLSHTYDRTTVFWPTADAFRLDVVADGDTPDGYYYAANNFFSSEHGGTHLDAPVHFARGAQPVDQVPLDRLFGEAYVVDVTAQAAQNADYQVSVEDLQRAEAAQGPIPATAILLLRTGFSQRWPDAVRYLGTAERGADGGAAAPLSRSASRRRALAGGQPAGQGRRHRHRQHRLRPVDAASKRIASSTPATCRRSRT